MKLRNWDQSDCVMVSDPLGTYAIRRNTHLIPFSHIFRKTKVIKCEQCSGDILSVLSEIGHRIV